MVTLVLDSDGGVDDAAALWYALTCPEVDLRAITVTGGNVPLERAADNVARVAQLAGRPDVPIALGDPRPYGPSPRLHRPVGIHGEDGVGDTGRRPTPWTPDPRPAEQLLADLVEEARGEITVVTLGPLRNLARCLEATPEFASQVGQLVVMGGAVVVQGNCLPVCEANIAHDPSAAAVVAAAPWHRPPLLVPLDVTLTATLGPAEFESMARGVTPAAVDLEQPLAFYRRMGATFTPGACPCHDLTAVVAAVEPHLVDAPVLPFGVDTAGGLAWGSTVVDRRQPFFDRAGPASRQAEADGLYPWAVALEADVDGFRRHYRRLFEGWST
jgi:purine nucleosidase